MYISLRLTRLAVMTSVLFSFIVVKLHLHSCAWPCLYDIQMLTEIVVLNSMSELKEPFAVFAHMQYSTSEVDIF